MTDTQKITAAEHHLLVAFAHCENTPLNGAPMQAQQPSDLCTWVWLDDRKVGDMTTPQKKGVLASLVKKGRRRMRSLLIAVTGGAIQGRSSAGQKGVALCGGMGRADVGALAALTSWPGIWRGLTMQGRWWGDAGN